MSDYDQMNAAATAMPRAAETAMRQAAPAMTKAYEQAVNTLKQNVATAVERMPKFDADQAARTMQDSVAFGRANMQAFARSGEVLVAGMQDMFRQGAASSQAAATQVLAGLKSLGTVRSVPEAMQLQASLTQQGFERAMTEGVQFARNGMKLAERVAAPLAERATQVAGQFNRRNG